MAIDATKDRPTENRASWKPQISQLMSTMRSRRLHGRAVCSA